MVGAHILLSGDQGAHHLIAFFINNLQEMDLGMAEREGFEPSKGYKPLLVFKTSAFNRSATSPVLQKMFQVLHILNKTNCNIFVQTAKLLYFIYRGFFSWSLSLTCFGLRMVEPISVIIFFALSTSCAFAVSYTHLRAHET